MNYDEDIVIVVHVYTRRKHLPQISSKLDEKQRSFIDSPFFCSEFKSVSRIVKIVHSVCVVVLVLSK